MYVEQQKVHSNGRPTVAALFDLVLLLCLFLFSVLARFFSSNFKQISEISGKKDLIPSFFLMSDVRSDVQEFF